MVGYVRPDVDELKVKDLKLYRAYYCGICTALSKKYGPLSRAFLSYDATFFAVLIDAFNEKETVFSKARCPLPPFQKKRVVKNDMGINAGVEISQLGTTLKMDDMIRDSKNFKRFFIHFLSLFFGKAKVSMLKEVKPNIDKMIFFEITKSAEPNEPAEAFGEAVRNMMPLKKETKKVDSLLYLIGKWVYLADALDDIEKDMEKDNYNPYVLKYKKVLKPGKELPALVRKSERDSMKFLILRIQEEFLKVKKDMKRNSQLIENIIFYGIPKITANVLRMKKGE